MFYLPMQNSSADAGEGGVYMVVQRTQFQRANFEVWSLHHVLHNKLNRRASSCIKDPSNPFLFLIKKELTPLNSMHPALCGLCATIGGIVDPYASFSLLGSPLALALLVFLVSRLEQVIGEGLCGRACVSGNLRFAVVGDYKGRLCLGDANSRPALESRSKFKSAQQYSTANYYIVYDFGTPKD